ncbi:hypothetical protein [Streptomyces sp. NPDC096012]|uniref:hypothetical protein n=1 Tax=Streptomyces sp. NPDC096012 TaxID=3155684 RepID=UPI00336AC80C
MPVPGAARPVASPRTVPVVRPDAPVQRRATGAEAVVGTAVPPVTDPHTAPLQGRPASPAAPGVPAPGVAAPGSAVPVVRAVPATASGRADGAPRQAVQREMSPAGGRRRSASAPPVPAKPPAKAPAMRSARPAGAQDPGIDLDDLARRLLEPVSRLLRADLRRGRERAGRPYDGHR